MFSSSSNLRNSKEMMEMMVSTFFFVASALAKHQDLVTYPKRYPGVPSSRRIPFTLGSPYPVFAWMSRAYSPGIPSTMTKQWVEIHITTIVYLRVLIIQIGEKPIILLVVLSLGYAIDHLSSSRVALGHLMPSR